MFSAMFLHQSSLLTADCTCYTCSARTGSASYRTVLIRFGLVRRQCAHKDAGRALGAR